MKPEINSAFEIIKRYWYVAPVSVVSIIRDIGIQYHEASLDPEISGMIERLGRDRYSISVNLTDSHVRQRFTAAHELGHYIYHRDLIGDGVDDSRAYRSVPAGKYFNQNIKAKHETEANRFAANLLMPSHLIKAFEDKGIVQIPQLASLLGVSIPAMRVRKGLAPYVRGVDEFGDAEEEAALEELTGEPPFHR